MLGTERPVVKLTKRVDDNWRYLSTCPVVLFRFVTTYTGGVSCLPETRVFATDPALPRGILARDVFAVVGYATGPVRADRCSRTGKCHRRGCADLSRDRWPYTRA